MFLSAGQAKAEDIGVAVQLSRVDAASLSDGAEPRIAPSFLDTLGFPVPRQDLWHRIDVVNK